MVDCLFIVFNPEHVNPIYFPRGGYEALKILNELRLLGPINQLAHHELCSPELFQFFLEHSLISSQSESMLDTSYCCSKCKCEEKSYTRSMYLLLSQSCNQKCIYCLNGRGTYQSNQKIMMPDEVGLKAVETVLHSITSNGRLEIVFFGGEPLLNWDLAKKVIEHCDTQLKPRHPDKIIRYHLTTNLTLFPSDLIETALKHSITFLVNIDGPEDIHNITRPFRNGRGSFRRTAENIRKLTCAGIEVAMRATVTRHNHHRMLEVTQVHKDLGGIASAFVPLNAVDSDEFPLPNNLCPSHKEFSQGLTEVYKSGIWPIEKLYPFNEYMGRLTPGSRNNWGCGAPHGNTPVITADGRIFSCIYLVGIPKFQVGDIHEGDFPKQDVLQMMKDIADISQDSECRKCSFRNLCGGGCPVWRFTIAGNPHASEDVKTYSREIACAVSKTVLTELLWTMGKEKRELL